VYDIASGGTRRLVDGGVRAAWWSPDGARLALAVDGGLVVVARDGAAGPTHVAEGLDPSLPPTWSPDGRRLAVVLADAAGRGGLVIVDVDG
jgi:Tol biopolymer transport system component